MKLRLKDDVYMAREDNNIILYSKNILSSTYYASLHPITAMIIALFDGYRTVEEATKLTADILSLDTDKATKLIEYILHHFKEFFTEEPPSQNSKTYNPKDFIFKPIKQQDGNMRFKVPMVLGYIITPICNKRCIYCHAGAPYKENKKVYTSIPFSRIKEIIDESASIGISTILLSGGEPFLYIHIYELLSYIISKNIFPNISTKIGLSYKDALYLSQIGLKQIQVSLDAPNKEIVDFLTGVKGSFKEAITSIKSLVSAGISVNTNTVIISYNIKLIPQLIKLLDDLGVSIVNLTPYGRSFYKHKDILFPSTEDYEWLFSTIEDIRTKTSAKINIRFEFPSTVEDGLEKIHTRRSICTGGRAGLVLLPDGKVTICERIGDLEENLLRNFIVGDLMTQSIMEIWNGEALKKLIYPDRGKYKNTLCYSCIDFIKCNEVYGRCFLRSLIAYNIPYAPDPLCDKVSNNSMRMI
ncbi:radical SAM protein [bacterium]|nr:radical SAM protein [bacterium]